MQFMKSAAAVALSVLLAGPTLAADKGTVAVIGAGKSGAPLAKILKEQGYNVRMVVRSKARATDVPAGSEIVEADVTKPATLGPALKGADYVISTIGAGGVAPGQPLPPGGTPEDVDYKGVANLTDAAKAAKVKQVVLMSSLGAGDPNPETFLNKNFGMVLMWKGKGEDHLKASGVPYTIVRPGGLKDCDPGNSGLKVGPPKELQGPTICRADVGLVMADALGNKDAIGKTIGVVADPNAKPGEWKAKIAGIPKT